MFFSIPSNGPNLSFRPLVKQIRFDGEGTNFSDGRVPRKLLRNNHFFLLYPRPQRPWRYRATVIYETYRSFTSAGGEGEGKEEGSIGLVLIGRERGGEGYNFPDGSERAHSSFSSPWTTAITQTYIHLNYCILLDLDEVARSSMPRRRNA